MASAGLIEGTRIKQWVMVKIGKRVTRHVLAVVPGDRRVDLAGLRRLLGGTYAAFASRDVAERLAGSVSGTILPFAWHPELELVVDPALIGQPELYFNAARLDRSVELATEDYRRIAAPRLAPISQAEPPPGQSDTANVQTGTATAPRTSA